jgi:hypothetical protein
MRDSFLFGLPTDSVPLPEGAALSYFHPELRGTRFFFTVFSFRHFLSSP